MRVLGSVVAAALVAITALTYSNTVIDFDTFAVGWLAQMRTPFLTQFFSWITLLGNAYVVAGITIIVVAALLVRTRTRSAAAAVAVSVIGAGITDLIMKFGIERARPLSPIALIHEATSSFPSGHATAAVALYGFLGFLLYQNAHTQKQKRGIALATGIIIAAIGMSRLYLGVHYPTDIVAGYLLGALWVVVGIRIDENKYLFFKK